MFEKIMFKTFGFRKFEFVSDFDIRISDFFVSKYLLSYGVAE